MVTNLFDIDELRKWAAGEKKPRGEAVCTPTAHRAAHPLGVLGGAEEPHARTFCGHIVKVLDVGRKRFAAMMGVHKSLVDQWCHGDKRDPLTASRDMVEIVRGQRRQDLIVPILVYIAGGDDFEGAVLTPEEAEALRKIGDAVRKS